MVTVAADQIDQRQLLTHMHELIYFSDRKYLFAHDYLKTAGTGEAAMGEDLGTGCVAALNDEILFRFEFRQGHDALQ
ncbi:hypothetical protein [Mycobacterium sp.]|uniref:hypothetical protein n=1 Tax=Mycobacterium sp. TaxID=1785 RepID=UPI003BAEBEF6